MIKLIRCTVFAVLMPSIALAALPPPTKSLPAKPKLTAAQNGERFRAEIVGELRLQKCVALSRQKISGHDTNTLRDQWLYLTNTAHDLRSQQKSFFAAKHEIAKLSPQAQNLGALLLSYYAFSVRLEHASKIPLADSAAGTNVNQADLDMMITLIFAGGTTPGADQIGSVTGPLTKAISSSKQIDESQKPLLKLQLANLEDQMISAMERRSQINAQARANFRAYARPALFAVVGTAAFAGAVIFAEPLLALGVAAAEATAIPRAIGQVAATSTIAAIGSSGIEIVNTIAIPLWVEAGKDSIRRRIPLACALQKQIEIAKDEEMNKIFEAGLHGAEMGLAVSSVTLVTPRILAFLGGQTIRASRALQVPMVAKAGVGLVKAASYVDEFALFTVVGLVGASGLYEGYETYHSASEALSFGSIIDEINKAQKDPKLKGKTEQLDSLRRSVRAIQLGYGGDAGTHAIDLSVCGYLLFHMAHGEFIIALEGEMEEVITALATSSDDAPTGINASVKSLEKLSGQKQMTPVELKLFLLQVELHMIREGKLTAQKAAIFDRLLI